MQENKFESIINTWRRMSGEIIEPATVSMSGDSPDYQRYRKKEEEAILLVSEKLKQPVAIAGTAATAAETLDSTEVANPEEKHGLIKYDKEESKEAAGDTNDKDVKPDEDYLDNDAPMTPKTNEKTQETEKHEDKVDSVYLKPSQPQKVISTASTVEEENCGMKCLYYTLQCCDCILM